MNVRQAERIIDQLLRQSPDGLQAGTTLDAAALARVDRNQDGKANRQELVDALVADTLTHRRGRLTVATEVTLGLDGPSATRQPNDDLGLAGRPWYRPEAIPPGGVGAERVKIRSTDATLEAGERAATMTSSQIDALKGGSFATVSAALTTPEDIALFLNRAITYDTDRAENGTGPAGAYSAEEMLELGTGICRDQHALARALLQANGYEASLLGYSASGQGHAVTAYKDPQTGYWGILEYGSLFTPEQLQARTPEEALMMVRPSALEIRTYGDHGPSAGSDRASRIFYTPTYRVYEDFMAGPSPEAGTGVTATNRATTATVSSNDGRWQGQARIHHDPRMPHLQGSVMAGAWHTAPDSRGAFRVGVGGGYVPHNTTNRVGSNEAIEHATGFVFASAEENHPRLLDWDIADSGTHLTLGSHTRAQAMLAFGRPEYDSIDTDGDGTKEFVANPEGITIDSLTSSSLTNLKTNPTLTLSREFGDTSVHATYGLGVDVGLLAAHYGTDGQGFPVSQYVSAGVETRPAGWLTLQAEGYLPLTNYSNDFSATPALRLAASTPYASIGTTQSVDFARYDVTTGVPIGPVNVGAFVSVDDDRRTGRTGVVAGGQLTVAHF